MVSQTEVVCAGMGGGQPNAAIVAQFWGDSESDQSTQPWVGITGETDSDAQLLDKLEADRLEALRAQSLEKDLDQRVEDLEKLRMKSAVVDFLREAHGLEEFINNNSDVFFNPKDPVIYRKAIDLYGWDQHHHKGILLLADELRIPSSSK